MKTSGNFVSFSLKLTPRVKDGHDDFDGGKPFLLLNIDGNTPSVVDDGDDVVFVDDDFNLRTKSGHGLVDTVVDYFKNEVVESRFSGGPDIHSGPFADGFKPFKDLDLLGIILMSDLSGFTHELAPNWGI